jgi:hypothetical protein
VQLLTLWRNFGYHASLMSGLANATGDSLGAFATCSAAFRIDLYRAHL